MDITLNRLLDVDCRLMTPVHPDKISIAGLTSDSRDVRTHFLFFALPGTHRDGRQFIEHALRQGAAAVVSDRPYDPSLPERYPEAALIIVPDVFESMAALSAKFYQTDLSRLTVIGITGTNGKSTIAHILNRLIQSQGHRTVLMGTIGIEIAGEKIPTDYTTPPAYDIHRFIRQGMDAGATWVIMEISSHALKLKRVTGLTFDCAIFTNLTPEHGEIHPTMDNYYETKSQLFRMLKPGGIAVINADDPYGQKLIRDHGGNITIHDYGVNAKHYIMKKTSVDQERLVQRIELQCRDTEYEMELGIPGLYNAYNAVAAFSALLDFGFDANRLTGQLNRIQAPEGRFQRYRAGDFHVVIDFAHTPDGLEKIVSAVRQLIKHGQRLIVLFGCPGDRDKTKRPVMGRIASQLADLAVVTSDDPHFENPESVIRDITVDMDPLKVISIVDRREAIRKALSEAETGDWVIIAGRGHERFQYVGDKKIPFHDEQVFTEEARILGIDVQPA